MAIYEYGCDTCEHTQTEMHGMMEDPEILCEECGNKCTRNITGKAGFKFKGSGFYATDYAKAPSRAEIIDDAMDVGAHK